MEVKLIKKNRKTSNYLLLRAESDLLFKKEGIVGKNIVSSSVTNLGV